MIRFNDNSISTHEFVVVVDLFDVKVNVVVISGEFAFAGNSVPICARTSR